MTGCSWAKDRLDISLWERTALVTTMLGMVRPGVVGKAGEEFVSRAFPVSPGRRTVSTFSPLGPLPPLTTCLGVENWLEMKDLSFEIGTV